MLKSKSDLIASSLLGAIFFLITSLTATCAFAEALTVSEVYQSIVVDENSTTEPICSTVPASRVKSTAKEREGVLRMVKTGLLKESRISDKELTNVKNYLSQCDDDACRQFRTSFLEQMADQLRLAKMVEAINLRPLKFGSKLRAPRTVGQFLERELAGYIPPGQIANFDLVQHADFSAQEKQDTKALWMEAFVALVGQSPMETPLVEVLQQVKMLFKKLSTDLLDVNPLLGFVKEDSMDDSRVLVKSVGRMLKFNESFAGSVRNMKTKHKVTALSYPNLFNTDHEMGLVNFPRLTERLIRTTSKSPSEIAKKCRAYEDLKKQQYWRKKASNVVGLTTAVGCGVGVVFFSAVAAPACGPAFVDGVWGTAQGAKAGWIAKNAFYSGRSITPDGSFTKGGVLSAKASRSQQAAASVVVVANALGLIPVGGEIIKGLKSASVGGRGTFRQFMKVPSTDVSITGVESQANGVAYAMLLLRSGELFRDDLNEYIQGLLENQ